MWVDVDLVDGVDFVDDAKVTVVAGVPVVSSG
jgi:hypothetical protein